MTIVDICQWHLIVRDNHTAIRNRSAGPAAIREVCNHNLSISIETREIDRALLLIDNDLIRINKLSISEYHRIADHLHAIGVLIHWRQYIGIVARFNTVRFCNNGISTIAALLVENRPHVLNAAAVTEAGAAAIQACKQGRTLIVLVVNKSFEEVRLGKRDEFAIKKPHFLDKACFHIFRIPFGGTRYVVSKLIDTI